MADRQGVSPTYLSKILTKLIKAGMIESTSGANGGYRLKLNWEDISFPDVIHAIEGTTSLFDCCMNHEAECLIQKVMVSAENRMDEHLRNQKLSELAKENKNGSMSHICFGRLRSYISIKTNSEGGRVYRPIPYHKGSGLLHSRFK